MERWTLSTCPVALFGRLDLCLVLLGVWCRELGWHCSCLDNSSPNSDLWFNVVDPATFQMITSQTSNLNSQQHLQPDQVSRACCSWTPAKLSCTVVLYSCMWLSNDLHHTGDCNEKCALSLGSSMFSITSWYVMGCVIETCTWSVHQLPYCANLNLCLILLYVWCRVGCKC